MHPPHPIDRPADPNLEDALQLLRQVWGYAELRAPQRRAILAVLRRRDCLAVLPTGGGKSLCYQVPALLLPGLTVVVSPLISLMQDQVATLVRRGVAAAYLSSTQTPEKRQSVWDAVMAGAVRILYLAPERLSQLAALAGYRDISLLAIDEAHCISEWGHEFRPHYRALGYYRTRLGRPPTIALTATATPATRADIVRVLGLRHPVEVVASFDRSNLYFAATEVRDERERFERVVALFRGSARQPACADGSAILYVPTRNRADGIAKVLRWRGFAAAPYHAGLPGRARRALLRGFLDDRIRIMVATTAFGMGIDKRHVRLAAHLGVPARPEAYYQEAGRAGRDGEPARCELFWTRQDLVLASLFAGGSPALRGDSEAFRRAARAAFATMCRYVRSRSCRRRALLAYLGEDIDRCSGCDRCHPSR